MTGALLSFLMLVLFPTTEFLTPDFAGQTPDAKLSWLTEQDHDFGMIKQGRPVKFIFQFKNTGTSPLTLETVRTTCGCTAAQWTETPIAPGETGDITVEYDAYQGGSFRKKIRVFFEERKKAEILWIRGETE